MQDAPQVANQQNREEEMKEEPVADLSYDMQRTTRNILVLILSDTKLKEVQFLKGEQDIGMGYDTCADDIDGVHG
jgi:hypothetical protein